VKGSSRKAVRRHGEFSYRLELLTIRLRDLIRAPAGILIAAGARTGMTILDFGCGPGGFSLAAARLGGPNGRIYALDIQPQALNLVRRRARKQGNGNIYPVDPAGMDGLPARSVDMALIYDVLHGMEDDEWRHAAVRAIHRLLKPKGVLSVSDHHMNMETLVATAAQEGLFRHLKRGPVTIEFEKVEVNQ